MLSSHNPPLPALASSLPRVVSSGLAALPIPVAAIRIAADALMSLPPSSEVSRIEPTPARVTTPEFEVTSLRNRFPLTSLMKMSCSAKAVSAPAVALEESISRSLPLTPMVPVWAVRTMSTARMSGTASFSPSKTDPPAVTRTVPCSACTWPMLKVPFPSAVRSMSPELDVAVIMS